ncbi:MAG: ATP-binding protein [Actinomycetota bacterium]|nr:ATP-binding protein [Actinomycetota bacterium]MDA8280611.1 ATP-binding protein [Actinomycetota bacterium]
MSDVVELAIPAKAELLSLARMTVAAIAARANFDFEEIEDLRLAIDELCSRLLHQTGSEPAGTLRLRYHWSTEELEVTCRLDGAERAQVDAGDRDLSDRILEALVDAHGDESSDGAGAHYWLRKRRRTAKPA